MSTPQIKRLVRRAREGDRNAFEKLYREYMGKIYRYVYFSLRSHETSEDVVQETFLRAWRSLPKFEEKNGGTFQAFLFAIARNLLIDRARKKREVSLDEIAEQEALEDVTAYAVSRERKEIVRRGLSLLSEFDRNLVLLRFFEDMSYAQIANILGKQEGAVRVRLHRALRLLKVFLKDKV